MERSDIIEPNHPSTLPTLDPLSEKMNLLNLKGKGDEKPETGSPGTVTDSSSNEDIPETGAEGPRPESEETVRGTLTEYRLGVNRRPKRNTSSDDSVESFSNDNLFVGPLLFDFNEPLPLSPPRDQEHRLPSPINSGDLGAPPNEGELARAHAVISDTSLEDLQSVVSAFGLEAPQAKPSCHSINHMNNGQSACCRHDNHNISWESLDLEIAYGRLGHGHPNYCCCHPVNRIKRGLVRRPCPTVQHLH